MIALAALLLLAAPQGQARTPLGIFDSWGAFRDASPRRCFAIAQPVERHGATRPFASIASWPGERAHNQLHIRLSRARHPRARVMLSIVSVQLGAAIAKTLFNSLGPGGTVFLSYTLWHGPHGGYPPAGL